MIQNSRKKILYIIPVRFNQEKERYDSFLYVLKNINYFFQNIKDFDVVPAIIEQDKTPFFKSIITTEYPNFTYEFVYNAGLFNRSWAFNVLLKEYPNYDVYVFSDADILLTLNGYQHFFSQFNNSKVDFVYKPKMFADLTKEATERILAQQTYFSEELIKNGDYSLERSQWINAGAICAATKQCIDSINWWDEDFEGWGGEDDALSFLVYTRYKKNYVIPDGFLYHFYHKTNHRFSHQKYKNNVKIVQEYRRNLNNGFRVSLSQKGFKNKYTPK